MSDRAPSRAGEGIAGHRAGRSLTAVESAYMPQDPQALPRLPQLDALRGLAALYVVLYHVMAMPDPDLQVPAAALPIVGMGGSGVVLFFVMSAFSLCMTWPRHVASGLPLRSFYLSRLFRIAPLLLVLLAVMVLRDQLRQPARYGASEIGWNLSMLFGLSPQWQAGIVMGSWTIGVEMLFYAVFPLLALRVRGLPVQLAVLAASYALALWAAHGWPAPLDFLGNGYGLLTQMPIFVLGCVIFRLWQRWREIAPQRRQTLGLGLLAIGLFGTAALFYRWLPSNAWVTDWHLSALGYGLILLGLLLTTQRWAVGLLVNRVTCFLGTISYSLYLVHPFLVSRLYGVFARLYAALPEGAAYLACAALSLGLSVVAAWATYRWVEKPGIRLGHRLFARVQVRRLEKIAAAERKASGLKPLPQKTS
ncbi:MULTISPECIES: acyltransferase family protein [Lysobacter]|jgi:peptidoglycan/LPS O-acetylase OafA/YrhL|uniref:acyltransferase family protein n=1 Tax=Lysobacter TaxID=68 RepID=UPI001F2F2C39|nr:MULTISPECIES: acyltransferase [Lysobacter]UJB18168.1 acyltransferase [Lysobacter capsici]UJQ28109.1 acyltransferase [Lysobacter gummosus]